MTVIDEGLLKQSVLFLGMDEKEFKLALEFYGAKEKKYKAGEYVQKTGKPINGFGFVLEGIVSVYMDDAEGNQIIMATNEPGDSFGEAMAFLKVKDAPCYIKAVTQARVLLLNMDRIINPALGMCNHDYMNRMLSCFAQRNLNMNNRIQVLSKRNLRQKLITLLSQYQQKSGKRTFDIPLSREAMAVYLGCDRSALSRELSKMKEEKIIDYYRSTFRIL